MLIPEDARPGTPFDVVLTSIFGKFLFALVVIGALLGLFSILFDR